MNVNNPTGAIPTQTQIAEVGELEWCLNSTSQEFKHYYHLFPTLRLDYIFS